MKLNNARHRLIFVALPVLACVVSLAVHAFGRPKLDNNLVMQQADARPPGEPKLDPNLHDQLLQALNPVPISLPNPIKNPFFDRTGLARTNANQPPATARPPFNPMGGPSAQPAGALDADSNPLKPFAERYRDLQRAAAQAKAEGRRQPPTSTIYSITEIEIYGHAQQGGAWVYGKPEDRAFTIAVNTEFLDAVFVGFEGDDAVFRTKRGRTVRLPISRENS